MLLQNKDGAPCAVEATLWRSCLKDFDYGPDRPKGACDTQRLGYYACIKDWTSRQQQEKYNYTKFNLVDACVEEAEKLHQCMMTGMFEISNCKEAMAQLKRCGARHDVAVKRALEGDPALDTAEEEPEGIKRLWYRAIGRL
uniref:CHCH domain-containing protein n=1 Tax=Trypanosoma congolense (strain IL3000) TaxID=1068625 RepID=G0UTB3_TRYCI|nr:conserved hypothetical protein [Trypanosoma congolense IL3000]